jgi:hypothetical protein
LSPSLSRGSAIDTHVTDGGSDRLVDALVVGWGASTGWPTGSGRSRRDPATHDRTAARRCTRAVAWHHDPLDRFAAQTQHVLQRSGDGDEQGVVDGRDGVDGTAQRGRVVVQHQEPATRSGRGELRARLRPGWRPPPASIEACSCLTSRRAGAAPR